MIHQRTSFSANAPDILNCHGQLRGHSGRCPVVGALVGVETPRGLPAGDGGHAKLQRHRASTRRAGAARKRIGRDGAADHAEGLERHALQHQHGRRPAGSELQRLGGGHRRDLPEVRHRHQLLHRLHAVLRLHHRLHDPAPGERAAEECLRRPRERLQRPPHLGRERAEPPESAPVQHGREPGVRGMPAEWHEPSARVPRPELPGAQPPGHAQGVRAQQRRVPALAEHHHQHRVDPDVGIGHAPRLARVGESDPGDGHVDR